MTLYYFPFAHKFPINGRGQLSMQAYKGTLPCEILVLCILLIVRKRHTRKYWLTFSGFSLVVVPRILLMLTKKKKQKIGNTGSRSTRGSNRFLVSPKLT